MKRWFWKIFIPVMLCLVIVLRVFVGEVCTVPSASMRPAIIIGDRLWIDKTTYGARLPKRFADIPLINVFTWIKPLRLADEKNDWGYRRMKGRRMPRLGDLAVFESPEFPHPLLVKRIVSRYRTGDTVVINSDNYYELYHIIAYEGKESFMRGDTVFIDGTPNSTCVVSQPYYNMLGDNRNNSHDSRMFGYVPYSSVVGRMSFIFFSINTDKMFIDMIRWDRFFKRVK